MLPSLHEPDECRGTIFCNTMHPEFVTIAGRTFYWYGVMMALAFLSGILILRHLARQTGRPATYGSDLALWVLLPGIIGARLFFVLANRHYYQAVPAEIWRIDYGGLIFYGGIIGGMLGAVWFAQRRREPLTVITDFLAMAIPPAHVLGRIGCFLNGCCYGLPVSAAAGGEPSLAGRNCGVAMARDPTLRHPVQLYEAAGNLFIFAVLYFAFRRKPRYGLISAGYLILYPALRFGFEFLRGDERMSLQGLSGAQWLSLALIGGGLLLARYVYRISRYNTVPVHGEGCKPAT